MDADRRRRIAQDLLDALDAIPADIAGPAEFGLDDLVAAMKIETELVSRLTDEMERGHRIEKVLDEALVALGGWRHITLTELQGDDAEEFCRLFADPAIADNSRGGL